MTALLDIAEVARRLSVHRATIYRGIVAGWLPPPVRLTGQHGQAGGRVAWPEDEIDAVARGLIAARDTHYAKHGRKAVTKRPRGRPRKTETRAPP